MLKKAIIFSLAIVFILPTVFTAPLVEAADQVCGMDGINYDSAEAAETAGTDVSYEFACTEPASEAGLYEDKTDVHFVGMLVEIGSTDVPTTIIVRPNSGGLDRTIEVTTDTLMARKKDKPTKLSEWIPGDQIRVIGKNNENTDVVEATILVNLSIEYQKHRGINGWITNIDKDNYTITYQWNNVEKSFKYDDKTRFVSGEKNPASIDDLEVNDRIRGRLKRARVGTDDPNDLAKIVVVLRRGEDLFMKIRTFRPNVILTRLDSTVVPTTIQVKMLRTPGIKANDVNNLIGTEGTLITVNVTEDTLITRKYFGRTTLAEFTVGDRLMVVGRVNDDGTIDAKMIKNNSIWKTTSKGHAGVVTEVNTEDNYLMVNWTPIVYLPKKKLKEAIGEADNAVEIQATNNVVNKNKLSTNLIKRINKVTSKTVGKLKRDVKYKKVVIDRIKHPNLTLSNVIKRKPIRNIKVDITDDTTIVVGTNNSATISDIQAGDKVRFRGTRHKNPPIVVADVVVVVNSLPEIEDDLTTSIDDVNEIVSEIDTDDDANELTGDSNTDTEEEITEEEVGDCEELWFYDSNNQACEKAEFCGEYMYEGLMTFATQEKCEADLEEEDCEALFMGYEFNTETGECEEVSSAGCENPYDYSTEEACSEANIINVE